MFPRSFVPAGFAVVVAAFIAASSPVLADDSISEGTRATLRADFMRQQAVLRAQSQLGYRQLDSTDDQSILISPASSRYATIDDQIARLAAMIAAGKVVTDGATVQP